jgi:YggT family protein
MLLIALVDRIFFIFTAMLFARILGSWVPQLQQYRAMQFVAFYTDPYLNFFRKIIPRLGMLDISPLFAFLALNFLKYYLTSFLFFLFF